MDRGTVVWVVQIQHVQVGVVDGGGESLQPHFVRVGMGCESFIMDGGFRYVEEGVDQRAFARVTTAQDDQVRIVKFVLGAGIVQELVPHVSTCDLNQLK